MGAAAGVSADQHPPPQAAGQLRQGQPGRLDVIGGRVRPGVPGPQHDGQRLTGPPGAVVGEDGQGMEAEGLLPGRRGLVLLRARGHDRRVDVHRDQPAVRAGRGVAGQRPGPLPGGGPRRADRLQRRGASAASRADQPGDHRVGGHQAEQFRLRAQHRDISQAVPAQRQRHRQIRDDLPRVVHRPGGPPPCKRRRQATVQARYPQRLGQQQPARLGHDPRPVSGHHDLGAAGGMLHWKVPSNWRGLVPRQALFSQVKGTFHM